MKYRILVVDDEKEMCEVIDEELERRGYETDWLLSADEAFVRLGSQDYDVVVTDLNMRGMNGVELCDRIVRNRPDIPVIVVTGFGSLETAIATLRAGAFDFLTKPFDMEELSIAVERAIQHKELRAEVKRLREAVLPDRGHGEMLGTSAAMRAVHELVDRVAPTEATILITGETGTGKELVARAIHDRSLRASGPLVTLNCSAVPEPLLESELFGHVRGAFTDARSERKGLFAEAHRGTLFLDEIGEMPLAMQAKLLRAIDSRVIRPVGGNSEVSVDVRVVAATHRDLLTAVEDGLFREDLYYRVNVVRVELPPLRVRGNDILVIAQAMLQRFATQCNKPVTRLSPAVAERLLAYSWPGNIRELRNCVERAVALARFEELVVEDLPEQIRQYKSSHVLVAADDPEQLVPLVEVEKRYIQRVMEAVDG
ncbi:MAG TPA: sigma-54 dependent transcriptional regulator, partial [Polyangiaceae bacterium]|nr:sigma-54 dependent transcriptional regulator [Polyangiaceae bacterium]